MNWNDLEVIWRRQEPPVGASADLAHLHATFEAKHRKMAVALAIRDWSEAGAGLLSSVAFASLAFGFWLRGKPFWPIVIGVALTSGVTGVFIRERLRVRRQRLGADATLQAKIEADIAELRRQRRLLNTVATWYLAPVYVAMLTVMATFYLNAKPWEPVREQWFISGFITLHAIVFGAVWALNRREVRTRVEPRLEELEKLRSELLGQP